MPPKSSSMQVEVELETGCGGLAPPDRSGCWGKDVHTKRLVQAILLAQLLSVVLAVTGVSSASLAGQGVYAPTIQAFFSYCLLAIVYCSAQLLLPLVQRFIAQRQVSHVKYSDLRTAGSIDGGDYTRCASRQSTRTDSSNCPSPCSQSVDGGKEGSVGSWQRIRKLWPAFAALAFIDVEANVLVVKAYQYTSLTSVTLLDCFTIPAVMLLSWLVLHSRYRPGHFLGAALCVSGLAVLVLGDARSPTAGTTGNSSSAAALGGLDSWSMVSSSAEQQQLGLGVSTAQPGSVLLPGEGSVLADASGGQGKNSSSSSSSSSSAGSAPLLGDALVLLGALLYSVCNVTQELILGDARPRELLAGIGVFGAVLSGLQAVLLGEWSLLITASKAHGAAVATPMLGFACAMLCFYSFVPHVLMLGGATVLNISLLSSDAWAALARYLWFKGFAGSSAYFFLGSLVMVASGIVVYAVSGNPKDSGDAPGAADDAPAAVAATAAAGAALQGAGRVIGTPQMSVDRYSRVLSDGDVEGH